MDAARRCGRPGKRAPLPSIVRIAAYGYDGGSCPGVVVLPIALLVAAPWVADVARADEAASPEPVLVVGFRAEREALAGLIAALKAEVREGRIEISDDAKLSWQRVMKRFDELVAALDAGDLAVVLEQAGPARALSVTGAAESFGARPSPGLRRALKACVDAQAQRVDLARRLADARRDPALIERARRVGDTFEQAKTLAAVDDAAFAWPSLVSAADQLDRLMLDLVYPKVAAVVAEPSNASAPSSQGAPGASGGVPGAGAR